MPAWAGIAGHSATPGAGQGRPGPTQCCGCNGWGGRRVGAGGPHPHPQRMDAQGKEAQQTIKKLRQDLEAEVKHKRQRDREMEKLKAGVPAGGGGGGASARPPSRDGPEARRGGGRREQNATRHRDTERVLSGSAGIAHPRPPFPIKDTDSFWSQMSRSSRGSRYSNMWRQGGGQEPALATNWSEFPSGGQLANVVWISQQ